MSYCNMPRPGFAETPRLVGDFSRQDHPERLPPELGSRAGWRSARVPLSFLGPERYTARIWKDVPESEINPNRLTAEKFSAASNDMLRVQMVDGGGFVARFSPVDE